MNILDNFESLLFCSHTFSVRRHRFRKPAWIRIRKSMKEKKGGFQNYLEYSFNKIIKISLRLRYKALDPVFGQSRIHITGYSIITAPPIIPGNVAGHFVDDSLQSGGRYLHLTLLPGGRGLLAPRGL